MKDCRAACDGQVNWGTVGLGFQHEIDSETAAEALAVKPDTLRKYLRRGIIPGRKVGQKWRVALSTIEEYRKAERWLTN